MQDPNEMLDEFMHMPAPPPAPYYYGTSSAQYRDQWNGSCAPLPRVGGSGSEVAPSEYLAQGQGSAVEQLFYPPSGQQPYAPKDTELLRLEQQQQKQQAQSGEPAKQRRRSERIAASRESKKKERSKDKK
jgi:hypothetical protein